MTIPVSTVPAAVAYLNTAIGTQVAADSLPILVQVGDLSPNLPNDYISIGQVHRVVDPAAFVGSGGLYSLEEKYEIDVVVSTWTGSGASKALPLTTRAWQLLAYVETAVRTDPSLGGAVNEAYPMRAETFGPEFTEEPVGLAYTITVPIHCEALN